MVYFMETLSDAQPLNIVVTVQNSSKCKQDGICSLKLSGIFVNLRDSCWMLVFENQNEKQRFLLLKKIKFSHVFLLRHCYDDDFTVYWPKFQLDAKNSHLSYFQSIKCEQISKKVFVSSTEVTENFFSSLKLFWFVRL